MSMPALQPLQCLKCQTPIPAEPNEVAWRCTNCGQANYIDEKQPLGLAQMDIHFADGIQSGQRGRPFWVGQGIVTIQRETYSGNENRQALEFWQKPHTFFVPAYTCSLELMITQGIQMFKEPVSMMQGQVCQFEPITLLFEDVRPMVEFIIMGIEAERRDMLKTVSLQLNLASPSLWIIP